MNYDEAAARLGILPASVKRQARAKGWPRRLGNDGRAQVDVPAERLEEIPPSPPPADDGGIAARLAGMTARAEAAERRADDLAADRDEWRRLAEALRADLAAERSARTGGLLARLLRR